MNSLLRASSGNQRLASPLASKQQAPACFHGGAFFDAIGDGFETLERSSDIVNADVLDAWFPPSPKVISALATHLPWLLKTSPPIGGEGLIRTLAAVRGISSSSLLLGGGSSQLIFLAFRFWLRRASRVLIVDPTYGEYSHVLDNVIGCQVHRLPLQHGDQYQLRLDELAEAAQRGYDLIVLVNPNNPTGTIISRPELIPILQQIPQSTRVWIDEAYLEYTGDESLETFAAETPNVAVCKSMSKVYALSGARVAYLCANPAMLANLRLISPPWSVSLPAQVAAVNALQDPHYYEAKYQATHQLRGELVAELRPLMKEIIAGVANFILCFLPPDGADAATIINRCRKQNIFLRDASQMSARLGTHALRVAVKDSKDNCRIVEVLRRSLTDPGH